MSLSLQTDSQYAPGFVMLSVKEHLKHFFLLLIF